VDTGNEISHFRNEDVIQAMGFSDYQHGRPHSRNLLPPDNQSHARTMETIPGRRAHITEHAPTYPIRRIRRQENSAAVQRTGHRPFGKLVAEA
jgi:hypothetical protein